MARTKEFDPDDVLERAMALFWEQGCENTSMADLVEHLGINRASLYATFGSKRDLYFKALARYREANGDMIHSLSQPGPALPAVLAMIDQYTQPCPHGCMIVNTAVELAPRDPEAARVVEASWTYLEAALTSALIRAKAQGELPARKDPATLARLLLVLFQGMRVLSRTPSPETRLQDAAKEAKNLLNN
ncbi:TetR/AcrR family transcriptional regulator [Actinomadura vinacea]|uniref:TetR/AcrR family transcriptional regulator n=1 Tax=Actinomadura vinacea TaxID=115336 RepID=A0ABN3J2L8_9ACTN